MQVPELHTASILGSEAKVNLYFLKFQKVLSTVIEKVQK